MNKFFDGPEDSVKRWSDWTTPGFDVGSHQWTTTTFSPAGGEADSSTSSVSPFTTWHSAVRITKK